MSATSRRLAVLSNRMTRHIGRRWGARFPFYYVIEFPKSGGTWIGQMVADCLQLPFPKKPVLPIAMPAVVHAHWKYDPKLTNVLYITRDGRDLTVSAYFQGLRRAKDPTNAVGPKRRRLLERLAGPGVEIDNAVAIMPRFIEYVHHSARTSRKQWRAHVSSWRDRPGVVYTTYESMLASPEAELCRILTGLTGGEPESWRVEMAVEKFSMRRQTGRAPGEEDTASFIRKGVAGDWKNYFNLEARRVFDRLAGDTLIELGYEPDHAWVEADEPAATAVESA